LAGAAVLHLCRELRANTNSAYKFFTAPLSYAPKATPFGGL